METGGSGSIGLLACILGGEGDFFLLSVTQKETGEAHQEFKGRYMNGVLDA